MTSTIETRSTCPYCSVDCGRACGGPLRGVHERHSLHRANHA